MPARRRLTRPPHLHRMVCDDYDTWAISAAEDPVSTSRWTARINQNTPPEIVEGSDTFLTKTSPHWTDGVRPLLDAGWTSSPPRRGLLDIISPDGLAGASIDVVDADPDAETVTL
ncbi:hypothetical protein ACWDY4_46180 [Streptomyces olivaceoviridis]